MRSQHSCAPPSSTAKRRKAAACVFHVHRRVIIKDNRQRVHSEQIQKANTTNTVTNMGRLIRHCTRGGGLVLYDLSMDMPRRLLQVTGSNFMEIRKSCCGPFFLKETAQDLSGPSARARTRSSERASKQASTDSIDTRGHTRARSLRLETLLCDSFAQSGETGRGQANHEGRNQP